MKKIGKNKKIKISSNKKAAAREAASATVEQQYLHNDSRVILRRRDVMLYELAAIEEHLNGLRASTIEVTAQKERLEARIEGLSRVMRRR